MFLVTINMLIYCEFIDDHQRAIRGNYLTLLSRYAQCER